MEATIGGLGRAFDDIEDGDVEEGPDTIYAVYVDELDIFRNCERVHLVRVGRP